MDLKRYTTKDRQIENKISGFAAIKFVETANYEQFEQVV